MIAYSCPSCESSVPSATAVTIWPVCAFDSGFHVGIKLGEGSFGEVYKAVRKRNGDNADSHDDVVAAKFVQCSKASAKLTARRELDILSELSHDNIVRLIGAYEDQDLFIQVFEYLSGGPVFLRLCALSPVTEQLVASVLAQVCSACRHLATNGIAHLDIKPDNIVCAHPEGFHVKLVDFGFARHLNSALEPAVTEGTPEFVSPEVVLGRGVASTTDMWSVGVLAYVLLSGLSPFLGENHEETLANISRGEYTLDEPEFEVVSSAAKSFISSLLEVRPELRMDAASTLVHPWLSAQSSLATAMTYDRNRLKNFSGQRRWKLCTNVIKACNFIIEARRKTSDFKTKLTFKDRFIN